MPVTVSRAQLQQRYAACTYPPGHPERVQLAQSLVHDAGAPGDFLNLAFEQFSAHRLEAGHAALEAALRLDPQCLAAHWLRFQYPPHPAPQDPAQAQAFRARWLRGLAAFEALDFRHPGLQAQVWGCVGSCTAFYRHYLGDCVDEQRRYGRLVHRMMAALDPGDPPRALRRERRRVLFASPYFYQHTVARLFLPLIEALDRERLDLHCLHFGAEDDAFTARARQASSLHAGPRPAPEWRRLIGSLQPDVIVYLDIGMHPLPQALAALRLAPVQAVLWGHPVSTGLPSVDYFLSPDAMEPPAGERDYSETLLRLPGLGHGLDDDEPDGACVASLGAGVDLLCAQSIYKLMPEQDALFARILAQLPEARLHLIPHPDPAVRDWLRERLRPSLAARGVDADTRVEMHAYRPLPEFLALARGCALNLDSIGWSGGMSALDLLRQGLPTITLPGRSMRSRQTAALLERMGVDELVVADADAYVDLAVTLARDPARRAALAERLRAGSARLHERARVAAWLQQFLESCEPVH